MNNNTNAPVRVKRYLKNLPLMAWSTLLVDTYAVQITKSSYTQDEDFSAADKVTPELGEDGSASESVTLATLAAIVEERASVAAS